MEKFCENGQITLVLKSDLIASRVKSLLEQFKEVMGKEEFSELQISMINVKLVDSTGISFLVGIYKNVSALNKRFRIKDVNQDIAELLRLMKLDKVFEISN